MKVGIIGSGFVGATAAYAMILQGIGREIVLVDLNRKRADAEADDLLHAIPFSRPLRVSGGDYSDLHNCQVVVITAGVGQKPGETRIQLLGRNAAVFREVIPQVLKNAPNAILIIATNPVDVMTHLTAYYAKELGVPTTKIIGTGTTLDTARFRSLLGLYLGIDSRHVHAYVLGEHGDSEVLNWSSISIGGLPLSEFCKLHDKEICDIPQHIIDEKVRQAAYHIIEGKGATYYGIGAAIARIVRVILQDERSILTVCTPMEEVAGIKDVTVSLPNLVGGEGILDHFPPVMNEEETYKFIKSVKSIREVIDTLEKEHLI